MLQTTGFFAMLRMTDLVATLIVIVRLQINGRKRLLLRDAN